MIWSCPTLQIGVGPCSRTGVSPMLRHRPPPVLLKGPSSMPSTLALPLNPAFRVAAVRRRTFGGFVAPLGRCGGTGASAPHHPRADQDGFRPDALALTRELGVSSVRYPGGNFVSGYRWEDGVAPVEERPARHDLAWHSTDPNTVGLDEFMAWAKKAEVEPMYAINLGTRGVEADRKSTRLNSSHVAISYAVCC